MIKFVEYKECTCDFCGAKEHIEKQYDMPKNWGWIRIMKPGSKPMHDYHLCPSCGENTVSVIETLRENGRCG